MRPLPLLGPALLGPALLGLVLLAGLAACSSPEERAQAHYQRALAYVAEGDTARATVEFRNVFRLDDDLEPARLAYADLLRTTGDARGALAQVGLAAQQHPDSLPAQRATAELAFELQDLETASRAVDRAATLAPPDADLRALKAAVDYRRDRDRPAAVAAAREVVAEAPGNVRARTVLVADRLAAKDPAGARAEVEAGLAAAPEAEELHFARVALLEEAGDSAALGAELADMARLYPDDEAVRTALVRWHLRSGDPAAAEAVLRAAADAPDAAPGAALTLARFLFETRGPAAAQAELRARVAAAGEGSEAARPYVRALAGLDYASGDRAGGIAALRALLAAPPASTADDPRAPSPAPSPAPDATRELEIDLAGMLYDDPDPATRAASRAESAGLVAGVLAADATNLPALKLDARAAIDGDRAETAIRDMRAALTVAARDPEVMTLTALAHERLGQRALMGEQLALAVEASNRGKAESLRYASFLMQENRPAPAEGVVLDALRRAPEDTDLLATLGRIRLATGDRDGVAEAAARLRATGGPAAVADADRLDAARLEGEGRSAESLARLESLVASGDGAALAGLVRARVAAGEAAAAEADLDARLAAHPDDALALALKADLAALAGRGAEAEALYRAAIAAGPDRPAPYGGLFDLLAGAGRGPEAEAVLDAGIAATGEAGGTLVFARAGAREAKGDLAGALADYETLYARSSADPLVANNLASLMVRQGEGAPAVPAPGVPAPAVPAPAVPAPAVPAPAVPAPAVPAPAVLERAYAIARRLQASDVPEFRDTLGWILYLRGDAAAAFALLDPAADALPGNAGVQFHAAEAARALGRTDAARARYAAALAAAGAGSPLPEIATVKARLAPPSDG